MFGSLLGVAMDDNRHWLTGDRLRGYPRIFFVLYGLFCIAYATLAKDGVDPLGKPIGYDFIAFWSAGRLALDGVPADVYLPLRLADVQREVVPMQQHIFGWYYPPTFLLAVLPLSLLPYLWSYLGFIVLTLGAYWAVAARIATVAGAGAIFFAFPGLFINALQGQNAFLTGALLGGALLLIGRWPMLAGVCAGLLTVKPHLAVLLPLAFIGLRAWSGLVAAVASSLAFLVASLAAFGTETLNAFVGNLPLVRMALEQGALPWPKMPTFFVFARMAGAPLYLAYTLQAACAVFAIGCVAWIWRQPVDFSLRASALVVGTLLVSPYLFDYDLALLALPLAWMGVRGMHAGWLRGERNLLVLAWALPALVAPLAMLVRLQLAPLVLLALLCLILRRAQREKAKDIHADGSLLR